MTGVQTCALPIYRLEHSEEVTQLAFVRVFESIRNFTPGTRFGGWLYRVVVNACMDEHRRRARTVSLDTAMSIAAPEAGGNRSDLSSQVQAGVARLPPKLRLAILLRYFDELSYEEIAGAMACSMGTVASRLSRAHQLLATHLAHLRDDVT